MGCSQEIGRLTRKVARICMYLTYLEKITELMLHSQIYKRKSRIENWDIGFENILSVFKNVRANEKKCFFCGNGGSAAIASHMTADFMKNGNMHTVSLYDNAVMTCMGNDYGYENVFSEQLRYLMEAGDLLIAISSSGKSQNIINAIKTAHGQDGLVITLTGFLPDNTVKQMGDYNVYVPCESYGMVESVHNVFCQQWVDELMNQ